MNGDNPCPNCGEPMDWVKEPLVSGVKGWFCENDDCPRDS